jgi:hypothetical protein
VIAAVVIRRRGRARSGRVGVFDVFAALNIEPLSLGSTVEVADWPELDMIKALDNRKIVKWADLRNGYKSCVID